MKHFITLQNCRRKVQPAEIFVAICTSDLRIFILLSTTQKNVKSNTRKSPVMKIRQSLLKPAA